jgi:hypothetical protein
VAGSTPGDAVRVGERENLGFASNGDGGGGGASASAIPTLFPSRDGATSGGCRAGFSKETVRNA